MEVGVNKSRNPLSDRVMGSDNGVARVMDFRENGGERCLGRRDHKGSQCGFKESKEGLVIVFGRIISLPQQVILVEDHSDTVLVCWQDQDVGIGSEEVESLAFKRGYVATGGVVFGKVGLGVNG